MANKKRKDRGDNPVRSVRAIGERSGLAKGPSVGEYVETGVFDPGKAATHLFNGAGPHISWYMSGKTVKKKVLTGFSKGLEQECALWILEYYHEKHKKWLYMDRGKGVPFGPWKEERALYEMIQWVKATTFNKPDWAKESIEWRIRNIETNEIVLHHIIA